MPWRGSAYPRSSWTLPCSCRDTSQWSPTKETESTKHKNPGAATPNPSAYFENLENYGTVGGMLLVKSFDRALKVGNAMVSRGYTGTISLFRYSTKPLHKKDIASVPSLSFSDNSTSAAKL